MVRFLNAYTISAFAALGGLLLGFDISALSLRSSIRDISEIHLVCARVVSQALWPAAPSLERCLQVFLVIGKSFLFSRKVAIQFGAALWCVGVTVQSTSNGVAMLIVERIISGLGVGISSTLVPIYQSEIAPRRFRGRIVAFQQFAITCGIMILYLIEYGFSFLDSEAVFRGPWAIQAVPAVVLFVSLFWFPHSPRWLASKDKWDDVLNYKEIEDQIRYEREETSNSFRELFSRKMRKRVFLSIAIEVWGQLSGMNILMHYIIYILSSVNIPYSRRASAILWGRRPTLLVGAVVMSFWLFFIGGLLMRYGEQNPLADQPYTWIVVGHPIASRSILACTYLAVATFAMSWGPVSWIYPPEIVPLRIRAKSVSLATAGNWATNFALGLSVPSLLRSIRWRLFFAFASFNIGAFIHVLVGAPETKRRTLGELDEIFEYGESLWKSFYGRPESNKLVLLARDIEIGVLTIKPPSDIESSPVADRGSAFHVIAC
ncbi:general substrate transporter [Lipomyces doorenjongii]|uniref:general substrate transporter n=1 Tax=Lipomyces doorenjongii TaxID=383834 RepID=UPI0034CE1B5A